MRSLPSADGEKGMTGFYKAELGPKGVSERSSYADAGETRGLVHDF